MGKQRKTWSSELKESIVPAVLRGEVSVAEAEGSPRPGSPALWIPLVYSSGLLHDALKRRESSYCPRFFHKPIGDSKKIDG